MTLKALIEAGKKATAGPWVVRGGEGCKEIRGNKAGRAKQDQYMTEVCTTPGLSDEAEDRANAKFIAASRNALPEIEELVEWAREVIRERGGGALVNHFGSCQAPSEPCTCGTDRIRETTK